MKFRKVIAAGRTNDAEAGHWTKSSSSCNNSSRSSDDGDSADSGAKGVVRAKNHPRRPVKIHDEHNNVGENKDLTSSPPSEHEDSDSHTANECIQSQWTREQDTTTVELETENEAQNETELGKMEQKHEGQEEEEQQQQQEEEEAIPPVTPKAKDIQYTFHERRAPPKDVLARFYYHAMQQSNEHDGNSNAKNGDDETNNGTENSKLANAQLELSQAGLLSLEDVLLPAIAYQENQALREIQRKIQRDAPDQTHIVKAGRLAVNKCLGAAILAARKSRLERRVKEEMQEQKEAQERQIERQEKRQERAKNFEQQRVELSKTKATQHMKEKKDLKKKFPPNQELWREVAYLMTESSKLERESRLWQEAEASFDARESSLKSREIARLESQQERANDIDASNGTTSESKEESSSNTGNDSNHLVDMKPFDQSMDDIIQSSNNIQAAFKLVTDLMVDSEQLRKNLYRRYRHDHQFEGYRGVNDPKGLIRILSQDTEA